MSAAQGVSTSAAGATLAAMEKWVPWWEKERPAPPPTTEERYRVGEWTLHAAIGEAGPSYFSVRRDGQARTTGSSAMWQPHDGWVVYDQVEQFASRAGRVAA
jgi:hypothetical protein